MSGEKAMDQSGTEKVEERQQEQRGYGGVYMHPGPLEEMCV